MTPELHTEADLEESMNWLFENTNFPTFEEFKKNPDKWRAHKDEIFESIQNGSSTYRLGKVRYFWRGIYEASSLENLQKIAEEEGFNGLEIEMEPRATERISLNPYKIYDVDVNVWPKGEFKAQGGVVANE
jgi:hypothetical protein